MRKEKVIENHSNPLIRRNKKNADRLIALGTLLFNRISLPVFNLLMSMLIMNRYSKELWGEFVLVQIAATLLTTVIGWGSQDYLLKSFTKHPASIQDQWISNTVTRFPLYILITVPAVFFLPISGHLKLLLIGYVFFSYVYKSFDVLILYHRRFVLTALVETMAFILFTVYIFNNTGIALEHMIGLMAALTALKAVPLAITFGRKVKTVSFQARSLAESFPFFLPSLIGLIQSRVDMYVIALSLTKAELAVYQVFISLLSMIHQGALLLISPYIKNLYRFSGARINQTAWRFFRYGIVISLVAMPATFFVLQLFYKVELDLIDCFLGVMILLPLFYYSIKTYGWFKENMQYQVAVVNLIMAISTLLLSVLLIPSIGIKGGLLASAFSQWVALAIFALKKHL